MVRTTTSMHAIYTIHIAVASVINMDLTAAQMPTGKTGWPYHMLPSSYAMVVWSGHGGIAGSLLVTMAVGVLPSLVRQTLESKCCLFPGRPGDEHMCRQFTVRPSCVLGHISRAFVYICETAKARATSRVERPSLGNVSGCLVAIFRHCRLKKTPDGKPCAGLPVWDNLGKAGTHMGKLTDISQMIRAQCCRVTGRPGYQSESQACGVSHTWIGTAS
ncbi:hypothetical protein F5Y15DRAFT_336530 [Xylariaceae sp. FL0016]|nr:hypothetical protein F5Y15DRAFT_336530 [Xylariaceae sp. FL0016]